MHNSDRAVIYPAILALGILTVGRQETRSAPGGTVEAERFVVRDAQGRLRAVLGLGVNLHAEPGHRLEAAPRAGDDVGLFLFGNEEKTRVWLFADPSGETGFVLADQEWKARAQVHVEEEGSASLSMRGGAGDGLTFGRLCVQPDGAAEFSLDAKGVRRVEVVTSPVWPPRIVLFDPKGKALFTAPGSTAR